MYTVLHYYLQLFAQLPNSQNYIIQIPNGNKYLDNLTYKILTYLN